MSEPIPPVHIDLVPPSSEVLSQVAEPVSVDEIDSPEIQGLIDEMFDIAYGRQGDAQRPTLVGLAAPQVGVLKRIVIVGINAVGMGEQPDLRAYINPEITYRSKRTELGREGCYSASRVCGIVERSTVIEFRALDRNGQVVSGPAGGFPARVFQHEVDHLDGIRFPDRITDDARLHWVPEEDFGRYRVEWETWPIYCPREKWEAIKAGTEV